MELLEEKIGQICKKKGLTVALAESCSGGALAARLVSISDASNYFNGSIVAYSNSAKEAVLGVLPETLRRYGAVSEETALEMAQGVMTALHSSVGLSITGVAGPKGGSPQKPVGMVCFGFATKEKTLVWTKQFQGDRQQIIEACVEEALQKLITFL
jgi:PncC family amidohydrolase